MAIHPYSEPPLISDWHYVRHYIHLDVLKERLYEMTLIVNRNTEYSSEADEQLTRKIIEIKKILESFKTLILLEDCDDDMIEALMDDHEDDDKMIEKLGL
jgi:hypothetical protein